MGSTTADRAPGIVEQPAAASRCRARMSARAIVVLNRSRDSERAAACAVPEQEVGDATHGRGHDHDVVTLATQVVGDGGRLPDGAGVADRGAAELDDETPRDHSSEVRGRTRTATH